jgi:hypothetical protein
VGEGVLAAFAPPDPVRSILILCLARLTLICGYLKRVDDDEVRVSYIGRVEVVA